MKSWDTVKRNTMKGNVQHRERRYPITYRIVKPSRVHTINPIGKAAEMLGVVLFKYISEAKKYMLYV